MKRLAIQSLLLASVFVFGCDSSQHGDPVVEVEDSDVEMNAAVETARRTFDDFLEHWKSASHDSVSIKFGLPTSNGNVEHIWFEPIEITDDKVKGRCGNDPVDVPGLSLGDVRTFDRSEISDWMILAGNKCYGGYTIRVLSKLEPENAPPFEFVDLEDAK